MTRKRMFLQLATWTAAVGAVALTAAQSSATVYMSENFESYADGAQLTTTAGTGWTTVSVAETGAQANTSSAAQSQVGGAQTGLGLLLNDPSATNSAPNVRYVMQTGITLGGAATEDVILRFDFKNVDPTLWFNAKTVLSSSTATVGPGANIERLDSGKINALNNVGNAGGLLYDALPTNAWYRMVFTVHTSTNTYDVAMYNASLNLVTPVIGATLTGLPFNTPGGSGLLDSFYITDGSASPAGGIIYYDNIVVESLVVPEPASLGLLGLGALAMIRRRRSA